MYLEEDVLSCWDITGEASHRLSKGLWFIPDSPSPSSTLFNLIYSERVGNVEMFISLLLSPFNIF